MSPPAQDESTKVKERSTYKGNSYRLLVLCGNHSSTHALPPSGQVVIGRGDSVQIKIPDASVSRTHARLYLGEEILIEDLGSANGTTVREEPLKPGMRMKILPGEVVDIGEAMVIVQQPMSLERQRRLWTHSYFEGRLEDESIRAQRVASTFALVRIHTEGRLSQGSFEEILAATLRESDGFAAYGPNAYELLLLDADAAQAAAVTDRIVRRLAQQNVRCRVGIACYPEDGTVPHQLVACASQRVEGQGQAAPQDSGRAVVLEDPAMRRLHELIRRIAPSEINVMLFGETGVGKEVLAQTFHQQSLRANKPMLALNCAALTPTLFESELFGYEKGAFTGADKPKPGLLESAAGGTVFLDEVGELPLEVQVKLLRVLEQREVLRVGSLKPRPIDVRFVCATNRDLEAESEAGRFRRDLFFRLNGFSIVIPPLRDRPSEIRPLAERFIGEMCKRMKVSTPPQISSEAIELLQKYRWPGNIRELRNVMERAAMLAGTGPITRNHLPVEKMEMAFSRVPSRPPSASHFTVPQIPSFRDGDSFPQEDFDEVEETDGQGDDLRSHLEESERQKLISVLAQCGGNQTKAAKVLGISRRALVNRLGKYALPRPRK